MFRHIEKQIDFKPVTEEQYEQLTIPLKKMGVTILRGTDEVEQHLEQFDALGATIGTDIVMFRRKVSASTILEETYHIIQNRNGLNDDKAADLRYILNEIDVKRHLLRVAKRYDLPRSEVETTKRQLTELEALLRDYLRREEAPDDV